MYLQSWINLCEESQRKMKNQEKIDELYYYYTIYISKRKYICLYRYASSRETTYVYYEYINSQSAGMAYLCTRIYSKTHYRLVNLPYLVLYRVSRCLAKLHSSFLRLAFLFGFHQRWGNSANWLRLLLASLRRLDVDFALTSSWLCCWPRDKVKAAARRPRLPRLGRLKAGESLAQFNWYRLARDDSLKFMRRKRKPRRRSCCRRQGADSQSSQAVRQPRCVPSSRFLGTFVLRSWLCRRHDKVETKTTTTCRQSVSQIASDSTTKLKVMTRPHALPYKHCIFPLPLPLTLSHFTPPHALAH